MWQPPTQFDSTVPRLLLATALLASLVLAGAAAPTVSASEHTMSDAADYTDEANVTAILPERTDHYPGGGNEDNGSAFAMATGREALRSISDADGAYLHYLVVDAPWIDFSDCNVENVAVLGFDRGSTLAGTEVDETIVQNHKRASYEDGRVVVEFSTFDDFTGEPPYGEPDDQLVAGLGAGSNDGPCLTMTDEPGWYQGQGFINGTEADNGEGEEPSEDADHVGLKAMSNYVYICECDSRAEAEEKLGPSPGSDADGEATPTPASTATPTPASTATPVPATATPTGTERAESTATLADGSGGTPTEDVSDTPEPTASEAADETSSGTTPTVGSGPGLGPIVALVALAAAALVGRRRGGDR